MLGRKMKTETTYVINYRNGENTIKGKIEVSSMEEFFMFRCNWYEETNLVIESITKVTAYTNKRKRA